MSARYVRRAYGIKYKTGERDTYTLHTHHIQGEPQ